MSPEARMQKSYEEAGGAGAVPWAEIIQALLAVFGIICPAKRAKAWARRNPQAAREMIAERFKDQEFFASTKNRSAAVEAAYSTFMKMSLDEIEQYM